MKRAIATAGWLAICLLYVFYLCPAQACLWDSDTLAHEAKGAGDTVDVIIGWFDRNPPLYYQMRLDRVSASLKVHPEDLADYDDAAVASDRLGHDDEALAWMAKKWAQLQKRNASDPEIREQRYRYLANTGTFWVHRWVRNGADRSKLVEVKTARDFIAQAIELNPNAHFGREKYQLRMMDWILAGPAITATAPATQPDYTYPRGLDSIGLAQAILKSKGESGDDMILTLLWVPDQGKGSLEDIGYGDAEKGLAGLITLGAAWESVDAYIALGMVLHVQRKHTIAELARLRYMDLMAHGKHSLAPELASNDALMNALAEHRLASPAFLEKDRASIIDSFYKTATEAANARNRTRENFMLERLKAGRHPDTDATFWDGYVDPPKPEFPFMPPVIISQIETVPALVASVLIVVCVVILAILIIGRRRRARQLPST